MKKDIYIYPSTITQYKDSVGITFPDLPGCVSNASNIDEAIKNAKKVLALHLFGMEEDDNEILLLVDVYEKNNINFSQVIQTAIKEKFNINA